MTLTGILTAILAAIPAIEKILGVLSRYFPAKTPEDRGVEKYKRTIKEYKSQNAKLRAAIKAAKLGRTKELAKIFKNR